MPIDAARFWAKVLLAKGWHPLGRSGDPYGEPETGETQEIIERAIATLAADSGVLRCKHGDRLVALYGRGVAAVEVAPRGAVV